jgi:hypothetical protein
MIKVLMERDLPAGFDVLDDAQAAWHARVAVDAAASFNGRMHWLCTYATEDQKLFGLVVVEDERVIEEFAQRAGIASGIKFHRVLRVLDPSIAGPPGTVNPVLQGKRP